VAALLDYSKFLIVMASTAAEEIAVSAGNFRE